jgi:N-methylhydantoinase A/oxoprolinase/acetone carboxylase beta subunit
LNALVERDASKLQKVAVIRLASCDFTRNTPPFVDFPPELRDVILGHIGFVEGGLNVDGTVIGTPKKEGVLKECSIIRSKDVRNIVIVGTFSPIDVEHKQEVVVRDWILEELGDVNVVCSAQGTSNLSLF